MTDRELLELAAKAAGYTIFGDQHPSDGINIEVNGRVWLWQPLHDDGDALRLAVRLGITVTMATAAPIPNIRAYSAVGRSSAIETVDTDADKSARRAIVRAAAEIGKTL